MPTSLRSVAAFSVANNSNTLKQSLRDYIRKQDLTFRKQHYFWFVDLIAADHDFKTATAVERLRQTNVTKMFKETMYEHPIVD